MQERLPQAPSVTPVVSVIVAVFNEQREYLLRSLQSILQQSFRATEIIVVDDSTSGETIALLDSFARRDRRICILRPEERGGLAAALNFGVANARGKYIARADADDIQEQDRLQYQVAFLEANPEVGVVGSAITKIDSSGKECGVRSYPLSHKRIRLVSCIKNPLCHPSVTIRKEVLDRHGCYDPLFKRAEDYELWLRLLSVGVRFANLERRLVRYRLSSSTKRDDDNWRFNLKAKVRHFAFDHLMLRLVGISVVGAFYLVPASLRESIYALYNRS